MKRCIVIVLDSLGIGALPDAKDFGDEGANTLGSVLRENKNLKINNLINMGLLNIDGVDAYSYGKSDSPIGAFGKMKELSKGKDTTTGHLELMGLETKVPYLTYPNGFPKGFIEAFESKTGRKVIGNKVSSGTEIIEELGEIHEREGSIIMYTSADSVCQLAANTDVISLEELYRMCQIARELLVDQWAVGRVIARPYVIKDGKRVRTSDRHDYALSPDGITLLDILNDRGLKTYSIGKIRDIFNGQGINAHVSTKSNFDGMNKLTGVLSENFSGLVFLNLVDFDSEYGHRRNVKGYGRALEEFDEQLSTCFKSLREDDLLFICADHGNDPTYEGFNHTREYVPLLVYGKSVKKNINIGTRSTFADVSATISEYLSVSKTVIGESFLSDIIL